MHSYANKWGGDTIVAGTRMALVEPLRTALQFVLIGVLVTQACAVDSTACVDGDVVAQSRNLGPSVAAEALFAVVASLCVLLGLYCLWLPFDPTLRLPTVPVNLPTLRLFRSYSLLGLGELAAKAGGFLDVLFLDWMLIAGYRRADIANFFFVLAGVCFAAAAGFCSIICIPGRLRSFPEPRNSVAATTSVSPFAKTVTFTI